MNINDFLIHERFKRNIAVEMVGLEGQQKLLKKNVLIAGAGGLGSGVIASLVSSGIGSIGIIDSDRVELSNLNRQFIHNEADIGKFKVDSAYEWVQAYSPKINISVYNQRIEDNTDYSFFQEYDLVIDCFDSYISKFVLNRICVKKSVPMIHGGVKDFYGQVFTIIPGESACLNCLFEDPDMEIEKTIGIISPTVNVISSLQSMEAVKFMLGLRQILADTLLTYDGTSQDFRKINLKRKETCSVCGDYRQK